MANVDRVLAKNIGQYCRCVVLPLWGQYCAQYWANIVQRILPMYIGPIFMANIGPMSVNNNGQYWRCVALPTLGQYCAQYCPNIVHNTAPTLAQYCLAAGVSVRIVYFDSIPTTKSRSFMLTELGINSSFWTVCCLWGYIFDQYDLWWKDVKHNYFEYYSSNYHIHRYGLQIYKSNDFSNKPVLMYSRPKHIVVYSTHWMFLINVISALLIIFWWWSCWQNNDDDDDDDDDE